ncbi:heavy metal translocating P-type ATPase [Synechocystis salina LEGE 06155]|nr:heavy metal translocating P-type ATPase [Synechocystis salina LEGE 06155]
MTMTAVTLSNALQQALPFPYQLVHRSPGGIRLKVPALVNNPAGQRRLQSQLETLSWVQNLRINGWAGSVVIHYGQGQRSGREATVSKAIDPASPEKSWTRFADLTQEALPRLYRSPLTLPLLATGLALASNQVGSKFLETLARLTLLTAAFPVARRAYASVATQRKINIDCLDLMALGLSGMQGKLVTPALVITLHELGDLIREKTARATEQTTADLMDTIGREAWVERDGEMVRVASDQVQVGETVVVYPGERIPVDGEVLSGEATVDQQQLTGESMPIVANPGTYVYAATLLRSGQLRLRCERVGNQTRAAASLELLAKAPVHDTRMANYAAQLADKLIVPSLVLAGVVYGTTQDPTRAASILTLDFVTGVRVSMPTAFLGALNHTTRHGVLVRSGRTLELLADIDTVVFDKTGTLTQGRIVVDGVTCLDDRHTTTQILQWAASAEQRITHPVAEAIAAYAQAQAIPMLPRQNWHYQVGSGMEATIEGQIIWVGSEAFLRSQGLVSPGENLPVGQRGQSVVYVANPEGVLGFISYTDPLRPESASLVNTLQHQYHLGVHVLTGDSIKRAHEVARSLGIPAAQVHWEAFPEDKAKIVRDLRRSGQVVAFVGDGLNDSVALAYADVSISFADGSDIARETADVVLMNNDLTSILEAIAIAKETQALIEQNTLLVVAPNVVGLGLAATVGLNPLWATLIHNGTAILAGLNSLRPLALHPFEAPSAIADYLNL